ncbi:Dichloromethane dehalogenase [Leminorella grimontii]|uniref:glutathione S-transferase N-terminal domain-containing protein n=1 Tax=Leminorella grimontii TaxID=82981 RepID=UPI0010B522A2|nr:Dichloromethane dehalogenase [Leminorella grimontii]
MYQLYIANKNYSSWSLRPWVLMSQLGIPFEETLIPFSSAPGENWEHYREFSPNGKVPCLVDNKIAVWDSLAIVEYLAESHPEVWPQERQPRAWARSACAEMHSGFTSLRSTCPMNVGVRLRLHQLPDALVKDLDRLCELWESGLEQFGGPFPGRARLHRRRCVLCARCLPHSELRPSADARSKRVRPAIAEPTVGHDVGRGSAERNLAG